MQYLHSIYKIQVERVQEEKISGLHGSRITRRREVIWFLKELIVSPDLHNGDSLSLPTELLSLRIFTPVLFRHLKLI